MILIDEIETLFSVKTIPFSERVKVVQSKFTTQKLPEFHKVMQFTNLIKKRDKLKIILINPDDKDCIIKNYEKCEKNEEEYQEFISTLEFNDTIEIHLEINKSVQDGHFSIYSWKNFTDDILNKNILNVMSIFNNLLEDNEKIIFDVLDEEVFWNTKTMIFSYKESIHNKLEIQRKDKIELCRDVSYFYGQDSKLLPDDFKIVTDYDGNPFSELFSRISTILSIAYISSLASINDNVIKCQITGQRNLNYDYPLDGIKINECLVKIFEWIYTDGNPVDKAIIARNIISLHCKYTNLIDIDEKTFSSIQSNYQMYLKENAMQYLEAKNRVSEYICNVISKVGDDAMQLLTCFKSNILAVFGFLLTVVLVNIVSEQPLDNIFTKDITAIIEFILLGSIFYFLICLFETIYKYNKTKGSYNALKDNYKDVFSKDDLEQIFNQEQSFENARKTVVRGIWMYSIIWIVSIIIMIRLVESISHYPIISTFFKSL